MKDKILAFLCTTGGQLGFALLSGLGYLALIANFVIEASRGMLLMLLFLAPVVVCGTALVIIKLMKQARENENDASILRLFWLHTVVILLAIVFTIALFV